MSKKDKKKADKGRIILAAVGRVKNRITMPDQSEYILHRLAKIIEFRRAAPTDESYTASLLAAGVEKICQKLAEEAGEVVEAAGEGGEAGQEHLIHEAADLLYHLCVLLTARKASIADVERELERRFGTSGFAEKNSR